jgi:hypothetical protein
VALDEAADAVEYVPAGHWVQLVLWVNAYVPCEQITQLTVLDMNPALHAHGQLVALVMPLPVQYELRRRPVHKRHWLFSKL